MSFAIPKDVDSETPPGETNEAAAESAQVADDHFDESGEESGVITKARKPINRSAVTLFVIIAIGCAGTYFMYLRTGPQSARAADPMLLSAESTIDDFMKGGNSNITLLRRLLDGTAQVVEQFRDYTNVAQVPLSDLKANPFHSMIAKLEPTEDPAEIARVKKEAEKAAIMKTAQAMQLQSIVIRANRKTCMINNAMYQEGDTVDAFSVDKITPNAVIVKSGAYRFELRMTK